MREPRAEQSLGRLTKRPDFVAAASGRRFQTERMSVQARLREGAGLGLRVGLKVTKRVGHRDILTADFDLLVDDLRRALRVVTKPKSVRTTGRPVPSSPPSNGERRGHSHA